MFLSLQELFKKQFSRHRPGADLRGMVSPHQKQNPASESHNLPHNHSKRTQSRQQRRVTGIFQKFKKMALQAAKFDFRLVPPGNGSC
jgi:hypothetical protein